MTERFMVDDAGTLIDMETRDMYDYVSDVCGLLNELHEENKELRKDVIYWRHKALNEEPVNCHCKVELNDIVGIVKTDEQTNSVELKKELYK